MAGGKSSNNKCGGGASRSRIETLKPYECDCIVSQGRQVKSVATVNVFCAANHLGDV